MKVKEVHKEIQGGMYGTLHSPPLILVAVLGDIVDLQKVFTQLRLLVVVLT